MPDPAPNPPAACAVFVSYAHADHAIVAHLAEALRVSGIDVTLAAGNVRAGADWQAAVMQPILECAVFIPVISAASQQQHDGDFRRAWQAAADRSRDTQHGAFIMPVVLDGVPAPRAAVPAEFRYFPWTPLTDGTPPPPLVEKIQRRVRTGHSGTTRQPMPAAVAPLTSQSSLPPYSSSNSLWQSLASFARRGRDSIAGLIRK